MAMRANGPAILAASVTLFLSAAILAEQGAFASTKSLPPRDFPETGQSVKGLFLSYWNAHGGLPQQGYPISGEIRETNDLDGKRYTVQYFERAVFERYTENQPPYDVLLSQLGTFCYKARYGSDGAPHQKANMQNAQLFKETGFYVGGGFLQYWKTHGGLAQQGFPISNEFTEVSDLDGKPYTVQYFERAVFEYHAENSPPYNILLSQLGTFRWKEKHSGSASSTTSTAQATLPRASSTPRATGTGTPVSTTPATSQPESTGTVPSTQPAKTSVPSGCKAVDDSQKSTIGSTGSVEIANVQYSGQEFVEIKNKGDSVVEVGGWVLRDKNVQSQKFTFADGTQLQAGTSVQIYTEPGHTYSFNSKSSIWNNCGDALELLDNSGAVVATYAYGTHLLP